MGYRRTGRRQHSRMGNIGRRWGILPTRGISPLLRPIAKWIHHRRGIGCRGPPSRIPRNLRKFRRRVPRWTLRSDRISCWVFSNGAIPGLSPRCGENHTPKRIRTRKGGFRIRLRRRGHPCCRPSGFNGPRTLGRLKNSGSLFRRRVWEWVGCQGRGGFRRPPRGWISSPGSSRGFASQQGGNYYPPYEPHNDQGHKGKYHPLHSEIPFQKRVLKISYHFRRMKLASPPAGQCRVWGNTGGARSSCPMADLTSRSLHFAPSPG